MCYVRGDACSNKPIENSHLTTVYFALQSFNIFLPIVLILQLTNVFTISILFRILIVILMVHTCL